MENLVKKIIGKNLIELRKSKGLTQSELAEKLNYSDKSISKWENGDSLPDICVLMQLTEFYGITLDDLVNENAINKIIDETDELHKKEFNNRLIILCLSVSVVFLIATLVFVYLKLKIDVNYWQAFIWAIPVSCLSLIYFYQKEHKGTNKKKVYKAIVLSVLLWSFLFAVYIQFWQYQLRLIFILGIPIQLIIWLSSKLNK